MAVLTGLGIMRPDGDRGTVDPILSNQSLESFLKSNINADACKINFKKNINPIIIFVNDVHGGNSR